ncbi:MULTISPECIES: LysR substrate-binding domain-containing protein [Pseudomonas]|uniref:LysR substrate-binding domain-containing protein n=1 Tax=Pseudomonas TaxID=286 RepID=UPI00192E59C8|nr:MULTISPECIES: LysR substrate-binding domain-containing protein [Pseudomonas]EKT4460496.1 hypothetical protein [Pseudomonas putida]WOB57041.1 LysR substrate-binding domain-containing protein [Pseudomonas sp. NBB]
MLNSTQGLLQQIALGINRLDQYRKPNQLIINTTAAFAKYWLLPKLPKFRALHPKIDVWLNTTAEAPDMATQAVDVCIRDDLVSVVDFEYAALAQDKLLVACHPSIAALSPDERQTLHGEREMDWTYWNMQQGSDVGQKTEGYNFNEPSLLLDAAVQGMGIALVSSKRPANTPCAR